jgi:hypothetical protein
VIAGEDAGTIVLEFDDDRQGLFDGNRLNMHPAADLRRTMGEMWLEGSAGVLRLDGEARLWWMPHGGAETPHPYPQRPTVPSAVPSPRCRRMCWHTCGTARRWRTRADYLANLRVQAAVYRSHQAGRRIAMAGFDPHDTKETQS